MFRHKVMEVKHFGCSRRTKWTLLIAITRTKCIVSSVSPLVGDVALDFEAEAIFDQELINVNVAAQGVHPGQWMLLKKSKRTEKNLLFLILNSKPRMQTYMYDIWNKNMMGKNKY
ncbi:hypothetical protein AgCh_024494 [Apium graveolens]